MPLNFETAIAYLQTEANAQDQSTADAINGAVSVITDSGSNYSQKESALSSLSLIYSDTNITFTDFNGFAQAICCVSLVISPNLPPRPTTHR